MNKIKKIAFFLLAAGILSALLGCGNAAATTSESFLAEDTVASVATTDITGIKTEAIENEVAAGEIVWKVLNAKDQGPSIVTSDNYTFQAVRGKFIFLEFTVMNNSGETRTLYDLNVIDSMGRIFTLCLPAFAYFPSESACALVDIIPGVESTYQAPFDVAPDSEGLILEVTDLNYPPAAKAYIDLGF